MNENFWDVEREVRELKRSRKKTLGIFAALLVITVALAIVMISGRFPITGMATLDTFENGTFVSGASRGDELSFESIPNFRVSVGEEVIFRVRPSDDGVSFSDDTVLFEISDEGVVEFSPSREDVGKHNVWIIIKNDAGDYYYQNVVILVEP